MTFDDDGDGTPDVWGFIWEQMVRIYQLQALPESLGAAGSAGAVPPQATAARKVIASAMLSAATGVLRKRCNLNGTSPLAGSL